MDIRRIPIKQIKAAIYNPRIDLKPGDEDYDLLAKGIAEFGLVEPLVWNERTGNLVGGHQRLKILKAANLTEVDVSVVDLDDAREKALNIALNKISGDWDRPMLDSLLEELASTGIELELTGFTDDALKSLMGESAYERSELMSSEDTEALARRGECLDIEGAGELATRLILVCENLAQQEVIAYFLGLELRPNVVMYRAKELSSVPLL